MDAVTAFVLHARPYRESSQLVDVLTLEQGRVGLVARGSRGARRGNPLLPFRCYRMVLSGRGELRRAQGIEALDTPVLLAGHALYAALYLNELLVRLLYRDVPVPGVFESYQAALPALAGGGVLEPTLRLFEKRLLDELGYGHRYAETVDGEPVREGALYTFDPDTGMRPAPAGLPADQCFPGSALLALEAGTLADAADLRASKRLMRRALAPHVGDRPLQSRALFRPLRVAGGLAGEEEEVSP